LILIHKPPLYLELQACTTTHSLWDDFWGSHTQERAEDFLEPTLWIERKIFKRTANTVLLSLHLQITWSSSPNYKDVCLFTCCSAFNEDCVPTAYQDLC
jgi:hypothetical protein